MERIRRPQLLILAGNRLHFDGKGTIELPKGRSSPALYGHDSPSKSDNGRVWPCRSAWSACRFIASNFPALASAFICRSQSSSVQPQSSAINSARCSRGRCSMAVLISWTVLTAIQCGAFGAAGKFNGSRSKAMPRESTSKRDRRLPNKFPLPKVELLGSPHFRGSLCARQKHKAQTATFARAHLALPQQRPAVAAHKGLLN